MEKLTLKQEKVLKNIKKSIEIHGYSPSIREIANDLNLKSSSTVFRYLDTLEKKGYISRQFGIPRSINIIKKNIEPKNHK